MVCCLNTNSCKIIEFRNSHYAWFYLIDDKPMKLEALFSRQENKEAVRILRKESSINISFSVPLVNNQPLTPHLPVYYAQCYKTKQQHRVTSFSNSVAI